MYASAVWTCMKIIIVRVITWIIRAVLSSNVKDFASTYISELGTLHLPLPDLGSHTGLWGKLMAVPLYCR